MTTIPFWIDSTPIKRFPTLQKNMRVDVLVIGAGITGITTAYLVQNAGFPVALIERDRFANQAKFHPRKYLRALVGQIPGDGSHVFERSAVTEFDAKKCRAKINRHWISFDRLVMATNNPLVGFSSITSAALFQTKLVLYTSYALGARVPVGTIPEAMFWDTREPYDYLRVDRHRGFDYIVYGGEDHKTGQKRRTKQAYARLVSRLKKIVPEAREDHRWSGQV